MLSAAIDNFELSASGIRKSFGGVEVLHGADLRVRGGSVVALLGENGAGKSTLVKILAGDLAPDSGSISVSGQETSGLSTLSAQARGIRMIHQELLGADALTVAENVSLGQWPTAHGLVNYGVMRRTAEDTLAQFGVKLDVDAPLNSLRVGERQVVEVARALSAQARCLILDEPTAALSGSESEKLFTLLEVIKGQGVAVIYITHRLDEVKRLADEVIVLRDGSVVLNELAGEVSRRELVSAMVGRNLGEVARPNEPASTSGETRLDLRRVSSKPAFDGVDLTVGHGEVVGLYGKLGSGAEEVIAAIFGLRHVDGEIWFDGSAILPAGPAEAIALGIGYLPADRKGAGAFSIRPAAENLSAPTWRRMANRLGVIHKRSETVAYSRWESKLKIRATRGNGQQAIGTLSGGNQQKVLLARWLEHQCSMLLLAEPTRGVDVGAREDIYRVIRDSAKTGMAVLVASSDCEEVVQLVDRAYVMSRGQVAAELCGTDITTESLTHAAGG